MSANEALEQTAGISINDIANISPFNDGYSTGFFVIIMTFICAILVLTMIALLHSLLESLCCCFTSDKANRNKIQSSPECDNETKF